MIWRYEKKPRAIRKSAKPITILRAAYDYLENGGSAKELSIKYGLTVYLATKAMSKALELHKLRLKKRK